MYAVKNEKGLLFNKDIFFFIYFVSLGFCAFSTLYNGDVLVQTVGYSLHIWKALTVML